MQQKHLPIVGAALLGLLCLLQGAAATAQLMLLNDQFSTHPTNANVWYIPTWVSPTDGTYLGRTQMRVTQTSPLPAINNGNVEITLDTYNPTWQGTPSFWGTDLISQEEFEVTETHGIVVTVRAKLDASVPGIVGGIFLYALKPGSNTLHDEIDFELLGNHPNLVQTNVYANEPFGAGHPVFYPYDGGTNASYHTYKIEWTTTRVSWYVDDVLLRTEETYVPEGPMRLHLNHWAPGAEWAQAYNASLQPVSTAGQNTTYTMSVDWVTVETFYTGPGC